MSFVSLAFVLFYAVVWAFYHLLARWLRLQNFLLLVASYFFYAWWDWRFLGLLLFSSLVDYTAGRVIERQPAWRRAALASSIAVNLGTLFTFKYFDFFAAGLNDLLRAFGSEGNMLLLDVVLPIGISFYTFQSMAYTIDVYRGDCRAERDPLLFLAYVAFFPQLVAGPIERANRLLPQFRSPRRIDRTLIEHGIWLIVWGYFLKLVVGDSAGAIADAAFQNEVQYGWTVILGTVAFGLQIYGDFCGYSLIAKGAAALLGFDLVWNFHQPYWARDVREFWQRWHVSLSTWLRDYLYIPLGGNRLGRVRTYANLLVTMTLGGLWHGAGWNFLFWGLLHGVALVVHRLYDAWRPAHFRLPGPLAWAFTMLVVFSGWFFFRVRSWEMMTTLLSALHDLSWVPAHALALRALLVLLVPVVVVEKLQRGNRGPYVVADAPWLVRGFANAAALVAILSLVDRARPEFIYFQF